MMGRDGPGGRSRLFTVRVWNELVDGAPEVRGEVRDVATGANRGFRAWEHLTAFLAEHLEDKPPRKDLS
jgi:hypothetical protein